MSERKRFSELSKSQKNRRLKKRCEQAILETARAKASVDTSFDNDPVINNSVMNNDNNYDSDDFSLQSIHLDNTVTDISLKTYTDNNDISHCTTTTTTSTVVATTTTTSITYNNNNNNNCDIEVPIPLTKQLAQWKCEFNITQAGSSALLKIIRNVESIEELKSLPNDSRTLIDTPTDTTIREVAPGEYFHYGLKKGLIDQLKIVDIKQITDIIQISIHIDGLPISKSSKRQLYPILGEIFPKVSVPFVIGIYHGLNKPNDCNEFLKDFINEYKNLREEGFEYDSHKFKVIIRAVICDSPARAFVTYTKGHGGFYGCGKCIQEGEYSDHRMLFLDMDAPLRTDSNFINRLNEDHHLGKSDFEDIGVGMVSQFPVDYMHLVCQGVSKKILTSWTKGWRLNDKKLLKLSHKMTENISSYLKFINSWIPSEFVRKTRGLDELDRWKATELRLFLLYIGPIALKQYLPSNYVYHYNCLQCAIRILCDENDCIKNNNCAKKLLRYFVSECINLYGKNFVIFNIHNLIHLPDDVLKFGPLDSYSAFSFESFLAFLKNLLKKGDKPLQQLHHRLDERANCGYQPKVKNHLIKPEVSQYDAKKSKDQEISSYNVINYGKFKLCANKNCDRFCYIKNYDVFRVDNICLINNDIILQGQTLLNPQNIENYPINSKLLHIVIGNQWSKLVNINANEVLKKAVCLSLEKSYYFFPLIHSNI